MFIQRRVCLIAEPELEAFIMKIVQATNHGISAVRNVTFSNPNWSFGQSFFFAGTVITTIGKLLWTAGSAERTKLTQHVTQFSSKGRVLVTM